MANDSLEPDSKVLKLTKVLSDMDEALNATLHPRKTKVIAERIDIFFSWQRVVLFWIYLCAQLHFHPVSFQYIFEGLAHLAARILIMTSNSMETIDQASVQRMCRNAIALQQTLSSITATREVALDNARNFYEMLYMDPEVSILGWIKKMHSFTKIGWFCRKFWPTSSKKVLNSRRCSIWMHCKWHAKPKASLTQTH